jgi:hypothetical protein
MSPVEFNYLIKMLTALDVNKGQANDKILYEAERQPTGAFRQNSTGGVQFQFYDGQCLRIDKPNMSDRHKE